ncbi:DDE-type integrase/transposase/recombinase [Candidatus Pacearchaeota archaeon]|nr:DDE-type integrase/transposase/recombinase [Candidatus Pacearchaeota archaeon]
MRVRDDYYKVKSQTTKREYEVIKTDAWHCSCPDHAYRHVCCKHIHAVEFSLKMREEVREKNKVTISPIKADSCLFCKSENLIKFGIRHNKSGNIQRFSCKDCHKTFSINVGFYKLKHTPEHVTSALQMYFTGGSLRNIEQFMRVQGVQVSHKTIYRWIKKYTTIMQEYLNKIAPHVGDTWRADEIWVKVRGELKYVFSLMDDETRFWIAQEVANTKETHDAANLFRKGKEVTGIKPRVLVTDGLKSYEDAYQKEFWEINRQKRTLHIKHIRLSGDMNNNKMERLNGEFRDREKVVRGIKKDDSVMFDGYQMYHNYLRPHIGLNGQTPAEKCGIQIKGDNKWLTIIQNAKKPT